MASIETRRSTDGRRVTYRVRWRTGGRAGAPWDSETFTRHADARTFKARIEANGHRRDDDPDRAPHH